MFVSMKEFERLLKRLGLLRRRYETTGVAIQEDCNGNGEAQRVGRAMRRIAILEERVKALLSFLELDYQTTCQENLPRIIKKKKK